MNKYVMTAVCVLFAGMSVLAQPIRYETDEFVFSNKVDIVDDFTARGNVTIGGEMRTNWPDGGVADLSGWSGEPATQMVSRIFSEDNTSSWSEVENLPSALGWGTTAATLNSNVYAMGGLEGLTNVFSYDGTNWSHEAGIPDGGRRMGDAVTFQSNIYYSGGNAGVGQPVASNVFKFNGSSWTEIEKLPVGRQYHGMAVLGTNMYVIGGSSSSNVYRYNGTGWDEIVGILSSPAYITAVTLNSNIYAISGGSGATNVYKYDGTDWTEVVGHPHSGITEDLIAVTCGDYIYTIGGAGEAAERATNVFKFNGSSWSEVIGLPVQMGHNGATTLEREIFTFGYSPDRTAVYSWEPELIYTNKFGINTNGIFQVEESGTLKTPLYVGDDVGTTNASEINVELSPTSYSASTPDVEAHLVGLDDQLTNTTVWTSNTTGTAFLRRDGSLPMTGDFDAGGFDGENFGSVTTTNIHITGGSPTTGAGLRSTGTSGEAEWATDTPGWSLSLAPSGSQIFTNNVYTIVAYDTVVSSNSVTFDFINYRHTPKVAGWYIVRADLWLNATPDSPGYDVFFIRKNGDNIANGTCSPPDSFYQMAGTAIIYFNGSSDYVDVQVRQRTGNDAENHSTSWFEGRFIGK
jgi:N-acetylneuraminic acid mutarotase